ncbi:hypothetical protein ABW19_dt0207904 [Dactylella cylindrospora]|nr:hypothetical protein ABW19_dt0207904 [Dactylella cylindrospora]
MSQITKYSDETLHVAHEVILKSSFAQVPKSWHWALLEEASGAEPFDPYNDKFVEGLRIARNIADAVWSKYYSPPSPSTRPSPIEVAVYDDGSDDHSNQILQEPKASSMSLVDLAATGGGFLLEWENDSNEVTSHSGAKKRSHGETEGGPVAGVKSGGGPMEAVIVQLGKRDFVKRGGKENTRPIAKAHGVSKFKEKLEAARIAHRIS